MKLLLECKEVDPNSSDNHGQTPLSTAAGNGHKGIVKLLLEHKKINPKSTDNDGQTPRSEAVENGYEDSVAAPQAQVNPNTSGNDGQMPLSKAVGGRQKGILKLLPKLKLKEVNPDPGPNSGQSPLLRAASNGYVGIPSFFNNIRKYWVGSAPIDPNLTGKISGKTWSKIKKCKIHAWTILLQVLALLLLALFEIRTNTGYNVVVYVTQLFARFPDTSENRPE